MLLSAPAGLQAQGPAVEHRGVGCIVAGRYPKLDACFAPAEDVAQARAYFRLEGTAIWYFVAMQREGSCHSGVLPKPARKLVGKHVQYYLEAADRKMAVGRTAEHAPVVVARAMECRKDPLAASVPAASVTVYPAMPAGFSAGGSLLAPTVLAVVGAGAATGAVLAGRGNENAPPSTSPPITVAPGTTPTTPVTTTTTLAAENRPPAAVFRVSPDPPAGLTPLSVQFNMCPSSDPDGDTLQFRFDFGDGSNERGRCRMEHMYPTAGDYVAEGCVSDGQPGHERCQTFRVRAADAPVTPRFVLNVAKGGTGAGTVTSSPAGIDCGPTCAADFPEGTVVTLTAAPAAGSVFAGWAGGCTGTGACTVTLNAAQNVTATFNAVPVTFPLAVTKNGTGTGTVTSNPAGIDCGPTCTANFPSGTNVILTAAAAAGSTFAGWAGAGCTGTGACTVPMTAAQNVTATFNTVPVTFPLAVTKNGTGAGTVTSTPAGIDCGATCTFNFASGQVVTLTPAPAGGSVFAGWAGACTGAGACTVTMTAAQNVTATFNTVPVTFPLTVTKQGPCSLIVTSNPAGIDCGPTCTANFAGGSNVALTTPLAGGGCTFVGWSGAGCTGTGGCNVAMTAPQNVTATYAATPTFNLTVTKSGTGGGTVTSNPPGIDCGATCQAAYASGTQVTLTAAAAGGSTFVGWSGPCTGTNPQCTFQMTANQTVNAAFDTAGATFTLTVVRTGTGQGSVTSSPGGINCPPQCADVYPQGQIVDLTATANMGSTFGGWSGGGCGGAGGCTVIMNGNITVNAQFDPVTLVQLTVDLAGAGTGTVTGPGINCPGDCTERVTPGTTLTLDANPTGGSTFAGWSGDCSGTGQCSVLMSGDRGVTATFDPAPAVLTVDVNGLGVVNSTPGGINNCSSFSGVCTAPFPPGSNVDLVASPAVDFVLWQGACSGAGANPNCTVTMNGNQTAIANFMGFPSPDRQPSASSKVTLAWRSELLVARGKGQVRIDKTVRPVARGEAQGTATVEAGEVRLEGVLGQAGGPGLWRFHLDEGVLDAGSLRGLEGTVAAVGPNVIEFRLQGRPGERVVFAFRVRARP
jgi:uncharacterized repeat protein (TIGR02543 family)